MATYGLSIYGSTVYGAGARAPFAPPGAFGGGREPNGPFQLLAVPTAHGLIQVSWTPTSDANLTLLRLCRSVVGYPVRHDEGEVLLDLTSVTVTLGYSDTDIQPSLRYYYALFAFDSVFQVWLPAGTSTAIATADIDTGAMMFSRLPVMYREADVVAGLLERFCEVWGYQLDVLRTEAASIAQVMDPVRGHALGVSLLLEQFGFSPEPMLGFPAQRQLLGLATELYTKKGSIDGARLLCQALTGWPTGIFIGPNLMLDNLDATFDGGLGRWVSTTGVATYRAGDGTINAPWGRGMMALSGSSGSAAIATFTPTTGINAVLQGIPVVPAIVYDVNALIRGAAVATKISMVWYDISGAIISTTVGATATPHTSDWLVGMSLNGTAAPAGAARLGLIVTTGALAGSNTVYVSQIQVAARPSGSGTVITGWNPSRQVLVSLGADRVNEVTNPRFAIDTSGWSAAPITGITVAGGSIAQVTSAGAGPPVTPNTYATLTAALALQGVTTVSATVAQADALYTGVVWVKSTISATVWLDSADPLVTPVSVVVTGDGAWHEVHVQLITGTSAQLLRLIVRAENAGSVSLGAAMILHGEAVPYFDGAFPSATTDYMWEATPNASRSHFYRQRTIRASRLRLVLPTFLPAAATFQLLFAQAGALSPGAYGSGPYGAGIYGG